MATSPRNQMNKERESQRMPSIATRSLTERAYNSISEHAVATAGSTRERMIAGQAKENRPFSITAMPGAGQERGYKNEAVLLARTSGRARHKVARHHTAARRALSEPGPDKRRPSGRFARAPTPGSSREIIPKSLVHMLPSTSKSPGGVLTSSHQPQGRGLSVEAPQRYLSPADSIFLST